LLPDPRELSLTVNIGIFVAFAAVLWFAGKRVTSYANTIAERTGWGKAAIGAILLGGITSLPEMATVSAAAKAGNAALAVNNLLGGVAMQVAILAIADVAIRRDALSSVVGHPVVLLQGTLCILLLALVAGGVAVGETPIAGVGVWSSAVLVIYAGSMVLVSRAENRRAWIPDGSGPPSFLLERPPHQPNVASSAEPRSTAALAGYTALAGLVIFAAGFVITRTGEAIAQQTGLGTSFVGAVFIAISTSLPEVSTTIAAVRMGQFELAFADIFGTNLLDVTLVFFADLVYAGPPVLGEVGRFSVVAALLGIAVTAVYLAGLIERRDRVVLRMGIDSFVVLALYLGGLILLYRLR
jgi:cation:H+ antiporter